MSSDQAAEHSDFEPETYAPALRRYFVKRVPYTEVEDLVQEVLLSMYNRRADGPIENLQGYIFTVAANVLKHARKSRPLKLSPDNSENVATDNITPERIILARNEIDTIVHTIQSLPLRTQTIFIAHRFEEMTYAAIAKREGISVSAVEKHIMQALRALWVELRHE